MPGIVGKMFVCDRCGHSEFMKSPVQSENYLNISSLLTHMITTRQVDEDDSSTETIPDEWTTVENDYLCPQCAVTFKRFMTWFFDEKDCPEKWKEKE